MRETSIANLQALGAILLKLKQSSHFLKYELKSFAQ